MANVRSTRRRLILGTGAVGSLNYALHIGGASGLSGGPIYYNSSWNIVSIEQNVKTAACWDANSTDTIIVDPLNQWYVIKSGNQGSSQRTNAYGYVQQTLSNMTQRFIMKNSAAITEWGASGVTESYASGSQSLHPANDVVAMYSTAGGGSIKCWQKVAVANWTYLGALAPSPGANGLIMRYSPDGNYMAMDSQSGGGTQVRVWGISDRTTAYSAHSVTYTSVNNGNGRLCWENSTTLLCGEGATPYIRYVVKTGGTTWANSGDLVTDNPTVGTDLKGSPTSIVVSPDGLIMVHTVTSLAAGKGHFYYYKSGGKWVYQGQIPSAPSTTTLANDIKFTSDGAFLIIAWVNGGIQVLSVASGVIGHLKYLAMDMGMQNCTTITSSTNHTYFGVATVGAWEDPAGRTAIDTAIEAVAPTYWWKCNEQWDNTLGTDYVPVMRNFGSRRTSAGVNGNICMNFTAATSSGVARVSGPPSATASYAMRFNSAASFGLTTNGSGRVDGDTSGTVAYFVKFTTNTATWRQIWSDASALGTAGIHFGLYSGQHIVRTGTTGASARSWKTVNTFNDGNWHFVVWRQPNDGTGLTCSVDGVSQSLTINGDTSSGGTGLNNDWFNTVTTGSSTMCSDVTAVQFDVCHIQTYSNTLISNAQELSIKNAAGL